jgi:HlyD family secretion protein
MARTRWIGKTITWLVILGIAGAGGWWYFRGRAEPPPEFRTVTIQRGAITQTVSATGQLKPRVSVDVSSQVSGRLLEVLVDFNTKVKKGDILAKIDPATFESAMSQSENELLNTKATLNLVRTNAERSRTLYEQSLISQSDLDTILAQLAQAEVNVRIREAALESRATDLSRCTIYAPMDGIVISRNVEMGQTVAASLNAPTLFVIADDLSRMEINAPVSEADIGQIKEGQDVNFTVDAYAGQTFTGKVIQVRNSPTSTEGVVSYATIIEVENPGMRLKPGMTANVSFIVAQRDDALRIANSALRVRLPEELQPPVPERPTGPPPGRDGASPAGPAAAPADAGGGATVATASTPPAAGAAGAAGNGERQGRRGGGQGGGFGGQGGEGRSRRGGGDRAAATFAVVYKLLGTADAPKLEAVRIRTGITDGSTTEVVFGLEEGDTIVTGLVVSGASPAAAQAGGTNNPFSGGNRQGGGGSRRF